MGERLDFGQHVSTSAQGDARPRIPARVYRRLLRRAATYGLIFGIVFVVTFRCLRSIQEFEQDAKPVHGTVVGAVKIQGKTGSRLHPLVEFQDAAAVTHRQPLRSTECAKDCPQNGVSLELLYLPSAPERVEMASLSDFHRENTDSLIILSILIAISLGLLGGTLRRLLRIRALAGRGLIELGRYLSTHEYWSGYGVRWTIEASLKSPDCGHEIHVYQRESAEVGVEWKPGDPIEIFVDPLNRGNHLINTWSRPGAR